MRRSGEWSRAHSDLRRAAERHLSLAPVALNCLALLALSGVARWRKASTAGWELPTGTGPEGAAGEGHGTLGLLASLRGIASSRPWLPRQGRVRRINLLATLLVAALLYFGGRTAGSTIAYFTSTQPLAGNALAAASRFSPEDVVAIAGPGGKAYLFWSGTSWAQNGYSIRRSTSAQLRQPHLTWFQTHDAK